MVKHLSPRIVRIRVHASTEEVPNRSGPPRRQRVGKFQQYHAAQLLQPEEGVVPVPVPFRTVRGLVPVRTEIL